LEIAGHRDDAHGGRGYAHADHAILLVDPHSRVERDEGEGGIGDDLAANVVDLRREGHHGLGRVAERVAEHDSGGGNSLEADRDDLVGIGTHVRAAGSDGEGDGGRDDDASYHWKRSARTSASST
jgi:hypothetical protein